MPTNPTGSILLRRGPTADRLAFCPLVGEIIYDTDTNMFYIGDGVTYGGVSVVQRTFPSRGVMIKGTSSESFSVAPGNTSGADYQFLTYSKANGDYSFSSITSSGVAVTQLTLNGNNGLTVKRTDTNPNQTNPTITTTGTVAIDVDPVPFKTAISLQNVTNESKATMFSSPTFTGTVTAVNINSTGSTTYIGGDLQVSGNVSFSGGANQLSATQLNIDDPMIYLAYNNTADVLDTGILAAYNDGTHKHAGLARDHLDNTWKFFTNLTTEPGATVAWANVTYAPVKMGALTAIGHVTLEGVTSTGATGTGKLVFDTSPTITGHPTIEGVTSTGATGTGNLVFSNSPTFTGTITGTLAKTFTVNGTAFNGSADVSVTTTGPTGPTGPAGPSTYDLFNFVNGKPLATEVLMRAITVRVYTIAANFAGCLAYCTTGPTSAQTINILKNGATIGTITFAIASTSGVFSGSVSGVTMNIGDQLQIQMASGASQDASFSDLVFTIKGTSS